MEHSLCSCSLSRCCSGRPARFLKSWPTSSDSSTKLSTLWGPIYNASATLWVCWTWPKRRSVLELGSDLLQVSNKKWSPHLPVFRPAGVLWWVACETGRRGALQGTKNAGRQGDKTVLLFTNDALNQCFKEHICLFSLIGSYLLQDHWLPLRRQRRNQSHTVSKTHLNSPLLKTLTKKQKLTPDMFENMM